MCTVDSTVFKKKLDVGIVPSDFQSFDDESGGVIGSVRCAEP